MYYGEYMKGKTGEHVCDVSETETDEEMFQKLQAIVSEFQNR